MHRLNYILSCLGVGAILFGLTLSSCNLAQDMLSVVDVEKRRYRDGFYIRSNTDWREIYQRDIYNEDAVSGGEESFVQRLPLTLESSYILASVSVNGDQLDSEPEMRSPVMDEDCDIIIMRNGDEIKVKVLSIGKNEISYKKCSYLDGPTYLVNVSDVEKLKYPNGEEDVFSEETYFETQPTQPVNQSTYVTQKVQPLAIAGFVASLVGLIVFGIPLGILALIFSGISLGKINAEQAKYRGRGFAIAGIVIGSIDIIAAIIIISYLL